MLIEHAINLGILSTLFFIIGMIKPKWALFFMEKPTRIQIVIAYTIFFMVFMTMYGQGRKASELAKKHKRPAAAASVPVPAPAPIPVPIPAPAPAAPASKGK